MNPAHWKLRVDRPPHPAEWFQNPSPPRVSTQGHTPPGIPPDNSRYYDGPDATDPHQTATWNSGYKMVQHLQESPANGTTNGHVDSTANGTHGTPYDFLGTTVSTTAASGPIDGAAAFGSANDRIACVENGSLDVGSGTWEAWILPTSLTDHDYHTVVAKNYSTGWWFGLYQKTGQIQLWTSGVAHYSTCAVPLGEWSHIAATFDDATNTIKYYINGQLLDTDTETGAPRFNDLLAHIGIDGAYLGQYQFTGDIDEVPISDVARSEQWMLANYRFMYDAQYGDWVTFGRQVPIPEPCSIVLAALGALCLFGRRTRNCRHRVL